MGKLLRNKEDFLGKTQKMTEKGSRRAERPRKVVMVTKEPAEKAAQELIEKELRMGEVEPGCERADWSYEQGGAEAADNDATGAWSTQAAACLIPSSLSAPHCCTVASGPTSPAALDSTEHVLLGAGDHQ